MYFVIQSILFRRKVLWRARIIWWDKSVDESLSPIKPLRLFSIVTILKTSRFPKILDVIHIFIHEDIKNTKHKYLQPFMLEHGHNRVQETRWAERRTFSHHPQFTHSACNIDKNCVWLCVSSHCDVYVCVFVSILFIFCSNTRLKT